MRSMLVSSVTKKEEAIAITAFHCSLLPSASLRSSKQAINRLFSFLFSLASCSLAQPTADCRTVSDLQLVLLSTKSRKLQKLLVHLSSFLRFGPAQGPSGAVLSNNIRLNCMTSVSLLIHALLGVWKSRHLSVDIKFMEIYQQFLYKNRDFDYFESCHFKTIFNTQQFIWIFVKYYSSNLKNEK